MNRDGSVVRYLALAHNERHPVTGSPVAKVIHNFGRADRVDREALGRLVASISRFLEPEQAVAAAAGAEVEILEARRLGGAWTLDRLWERLTRGGGHYIHAEKLRATNAEATAALARPGRYHRVADNLRVKEVQVAPGGDGDGDDGVRTQRFVICHNPAQADRDAAVRTNLVEHLRGLIEGS